MIVARDAAQVEDRVTPQQPLDDVLLGLAQHLAVERAVSCIEVRSQGALKAAHLGRNPRVERLDLGPLAKEHLRHGMRRTLGDPQHHADLERPGGEREVGLDIGRDALHRAKHHAVTLTLTEKRRSSELMALATAPGK